MISRRALACAAFALVTAAQAACTLDTVSTDDGGGAPSGPARTVGDQCLDVLNTFCQREAACAIPVDGTCAMNAESVCCSGTACNATSMVPETRVSACKTSVMNLDCNTVVNTTDPTTCIK